MPNARDPQTTTANSCATRSTIVLPLRLPPGDAIDQPGCCAMHTSKIPTVLSDVTKPPSAFVEPVISPCRQSQHKSCALANLQRWLRQSHVHRFDLYRPKLSIEINPPTRFLHCADRAVCRWADATQLIIARAAAQITVAAAARGASKLMNYRLDWRIRL